MPVIIGDDERAFQFWRALYDAGYGSSSRLYERADSQLGMTPAVYQRGGRGMEIGYAIAACPLGRLLDPLTQDSAAFYDDHALFEEFSGVVLDTSEGQKIARALGAKKAVILQNHGILTVGLAICGKMNTSRQQVIWD